MSSLRRIIGPRQKNQHVGVMAVSLIGQGSRAFSVIGSKADLCRSHSGALIHDLSGRLLTYRYVRGGGAAWGVGDYAAASARPLAMASLMN